MVADRNGTSGSGYLFAQALGSRSIDFAKMTAAEKVGEAIRRSLPMLPADVREEIEALLTKEAIATMTVVLVAWGVSHFFGAGEFIDGALLLLGAIALGGAALEAGEELYNFAKLSVNATKDEDLSQAAKHFSNAVALIGVQTVMAILLKKSPKAFREPRNFINRKLVKPLSLKTMAPLPRTPGKIYSRKSTPILDSQASNLS